MNLIILQAAWALHFSWFLWAGCHGTCLNRQGTIALSTPEGYISYKDDYKRADCSYLFPNVLTTEYDVMLAQVTQIDMQYRSGKGCAGDVILKGELSDITFCDKPMEGCFLYYTTNSKCSLEELHEILMEASTPCSKSSLMLVESFPERLRIKSRDSKMKSVTMEYKYIKCHDEKAAERFLQPTTTPAAVNTIVPTTASGNSLTPTKNGSAPSGCLKSGNSTGLSTCDVLTAVCIGLGVILILMTAYLGYQSWKRRRAKFHVSEKDEGVEGDKTSSSDEMAVFQVEQVSLNDVTQYTGKMGDRTV